MSKARVIRGIARQTVVSKLEKLKATGLQALINSNVSNITEADIAELTALIDQRIAELS